MFLKFNFSRLSTDCLMAIVSLGDSIEAESLGISIVSLEAELSMVLMFSFEFISLKIFIRS